MLIQCQSTRILIVCHKFILIKMLFVYILIFSDKIQEFLLNASHKCLSYKCNLVQIIFDWLFKVANDYQCAWFKFTGMFLSYYDKPIFNSVNAVNFLN